MTALYYFNPITVTKGLLTKDAISWSKVYNLIGRAVGMNDRSGTLTQPIKQAIYDRCRLPVLEDRAYSYEECCDRRARELWDLSTELGKPIGILWSGGIDSTGIVVSFLRNFSLAELKSRVKIIISMESILENKNFYTNHILPNFEFVNSEYLPWLFDGSMLIISGELNDQLFGSDLISKFLLNEGQIGRAHV